MTLLRRHILVGQRTAIGSTVANPAPKANANNKLILLIFYYLVFDYMVVLFTAVPLVESRYLTVLKVSYRRTELIFLHHYWYSEM